ncbi:replication/maintenance protein RepL [Clostridium tertium]|uniref:replication/maintenance protein RepL n=1 Tax=Clostridium tertium TaxID=1559 RepID=UPI0035627CD7
MNTITVGNERNLLNPNSLTFEERQKQLENETKREKEEQERVKKSPFNNFIQVNRDYYKAEDWLMSKSPIAYRIFKFLINNMDGYNAVVCSYKVLQEHFDISQVTVARAIKLLKEKQYIGIYKSGTSNIYCVNKNIVWSSWGSNYKYAKFGANIILSKAEQEIQEEKEKNKVKIKTEKIKQVVINEEKMVKK